jgi:hypothetical protein
MAPTHSKFIPEPRAPGAPKRVLAASLASTDNVDVAAVKRRKLEAVQRQQRQPSVQDADREDDDTDIDDTSDTNLQPRNASRILEAADGSDDIQFDSDVGANGGDSDDEMPGLEEVDDASDGELEDEEGEGHDEGEEEEVPVAETDEEELGKSPASDYYCTTVTRFFF